jgi:hypothetical protein
VIVLNEGMSHFLVDPRLCRPHPCRSDQVMPLRLAALRPAIVDDPPGHWSRLPPCMFRCLLSAPSAMDFGARPGGATALRAGERTARKTITSADPPTSGGGGSFPSTSIDRGKNWKRGQRHALKKREIERGGGKASQVAPEAVAQMDTEPSIVSPSPATSGEPRLAGGTRTAGVAFRLRPSWHRSLGTSVAATCSSRARCNPERTRSRGRNLHGMSQSANCVTEAQRIGQVGIDCWEPWPRPV